MDRVDMSKIDAEKKVERILKFVKRRSRAKKEPEIVGVVEDFHKQYQLLYNQYDNLKRDPSRKPPTGKGNESCSYASSGSEYYSSEYVEMNKALRSNRSSFRRMATDLEFEVRKTYAEVADLKHQLACRTKEMEVLDSNHQDALSEIKEMETVNGDLRNEMDETERRLFVIETMHKARVAELEEQLTGLKTENSELKAQLDVHVKLIKDNESDLTSIMKKELDSVGSQNTEFEIMLDRKSKEISQYLIQVKTLKEELARKSAAEKRIAEEKEGLQVQVMDLESEIDAVRKQKNQSEDEAKRNIRELNARIQELETSLRDGGLEFSVLQEDSKSKMINEAAQMKEQVELLQPKLNSMNNEKIANQKRSTKEIDESTNKSMPPKTTLVRRLSLNNLNHYHLEKKVEDLAQEFHKKVEDSTRLLYQRIKVPEKMHHENTQVYKLTKEKLEQENESLKQKAVTYEAELRKLKDTMESDKNSMTMVYKLEEDRNILTPMSNVTDDAISITDECDGETETRIERAKSNVDRLVAEIFKENEKALLREKVMNLEVKLSEVGKEKMVLKAMVELEKKMREMQKENEEKVMNLKGKLSEGSKAMNELEKKLKELEKIVKEKDEILLDREEEKREAIRQLCLLIDYHRSSCDHLKQSISSLAVKRK